MKNRTNQAKINIIYGLASKVIMMLLEFISRYFFIKYLGSELLGVNGVFTNIIQCLSLAELGMNNVVMFSYYKPLAENNVRKLSALNTFYKRVYNGIALAVAVVGFCLIPFLKYIINTDIVITNLTHIYILFLIDTVMSYLCIYKITILTADQNSYIVTKYDMVLNSIRVFCQIISLILFKNFIIYLFIKILFSIGGNIIKAKKVDREYTFTEKEEPLSLQEKKSIFEMIKSGFIYKLSAILLNSTDNVIISFLVGTVWVGLLANYVTLCTSVASFVTIAYNNITASVGNLVTTEKKERKLYIFNVMSVVSCWVAFVFFICTLVLSDDFIRLWLGKEYVMDFSIVLPKIMMLYVSCIMQPIFTFREALGLYTKTKYVMLLSAILNIGLSLILGNLWGTSGVLIASLIAVGTTYFWFEPLVLFKDCFETSVIPYYFRIATNIFICFFTTILALKLDKYISFCGWVGFIAKGCIIFIIVNIECYLVYGKTEEFRFLIKKLRRN